MGYAQGLRHKGHQNAVVKCVIGDGTCAEDDLHEGMTGASILQLPWLLTVTDNQIAISVRPEDGRGIRDFEAVDALARAIGLALVEDNAMPANNRALVWQKTIEKEQAK